MASFMGECVLMCLECVPGARVEDWVVEGLLYVEEGLG